MRIALCDKNSNDSLKTKNFIYEYANLRKLDMLVECYSSGKELLESGKKHLIVFLEVNLGEVNGLETARLLRERDNNCIIIFLSNNTEFVLDSFKVRPYRFLLKPLEKTALFSTFDDLFKNIGIDRPLWVKDGDDTFCFNTCDIFYLEANNKNCTINLRNKKIHCHKTMARVYGVLPKNHFCKINRAYVVNFNYITEYSSNSIKLRNGESLPVSRGYSESFKNEYRAYSRPNEM